MSATASEVTGESPIGRRGRGAPWGSLLRLRERTGLPLFCVDAISGDLLGSENAELPPFVPELLRGRLAAVRAVTLFPQSSGLVGYAIPLPGTGGRHVAFGFQLTAGFDLPVELERAAAGAGWSRKRLDRWISGHPRCSPGPLKSLLELAASELETSRLAAASRAQVDQISEQLEHTYEEIALLHALTRNLQISRGPADLAALCLERMPELIDAEGHFIRLHTPDDEPNIWTRGTLPFDLSDLEELLGRFEPGSAGRPLVKNRIDATPVGRSFPELRSLVAVPVREGKHRFGWIVSANMRGDREFGTVEASFLNTIATILGTHVRNIGLLRDHSDLLLGFVRSFVSSLDAKDPYTRGHSERVALIARRIGKEMGLPDDELKTIHLSGLLHDIGKIGVDDQILRKAGRLTNEEFDQVKKHPMIGYNILSGLKNLKHVLPGVRNHHENFDGSGYPDGLAGEEIPQLARILAVADGYDAMGSDRPYRKGMPVERIDGIFREGAGTQWDARILDAYFRCREDVRMICAAYSLESGCPVGG